MSPPPVLESKLRAIFEEDPECKLTLAALAVMLGVNEQAVSNAMWRLRQKDFFIRPIQVFRRTRA